MSVWKSNFFLQTGLPAALPKPPVRNAVLDERFAAEHRLPRRFGGRGIDKIPRRIRPPLLFNFYEGMRHIELREADASVLFPSKQAKKEFRAHTQHQRAFWEYMLELYVLFEQQERAADPPPEEETPKIRKKRLRRKFYFLKEPEQQQLVRDHITDRWERENYAHVRETCHQENLRHLVDIRRDLRLLLAKVGRALDPTDDLTLDPTEESQELALDSMDEEPEEPEEPQDLIAQELEPVTPE